MTRPSRSRILPRGAGMGKDLMLLRSACSLYIWGFWTCRFQKPVIRNRKMATPAYWKTAIFPAANLTSSRRACLPGSLGGRSSSGPMTGGFTGLGGLLYLVYQEEDRRGA